MPEQRKEAAPREATPIERNKQILRTDQGSTQRPRPTVDVAAPLHAKMDAGIAALAAANDPQHPDVLVRGNALVRMTERGALEPVDLDSLRVLLSRAEAFHKRDGEDERRPTDPPVDAARAILAADSSAYAGVPRVERVIDVPVLDASGELVTDPGYHAASQLYYQPAEGLEGVGPRDADSTEEVEWALDKLLVDLLGDFDFVDEADKAHALATLLTPFVREYIGAGSTPLHVVLAPDNGSGKTWLAKALLIPGCGSVPVTPPTTSDEEWRKRITTLLLAGKPAVLLDNLSGTLDTGSLASALTDSTWNDRVLGESLEVTLPIRNLWVATGNNLGLSPEMTRRSIASFLEASEVKASDRDPREYKHPNLLVWATARRRELVEAALTLIDHWRRGPVGGVVGGYVYARTGEAAQESIHTFGSYERWAAIVGGILESAEVPGFLANRDKLKAEADGESREAREFLAALHEQTGGEPRQSRDIADNLCGPGKPLADFLPTAPAEAPLGKLARALGQWFGENKNKSVGGYTLRSRPLGGKGNPTGWYVQDRAQRQASGEASEPVAAA